MKHQQQAPKWLLTTALLAVLGANYGFQTNSLAMHKDEVEVFELSSREGRPASGTASVSGSATVSGSTSVSGSAAASGSAEARPLPQTGSEDKTGKTVELKREGQVLATGTCADGSCKSVVLEMSTLHRFAENIAAATRAVTSSAVVARPASSVTVVAAPVAAAESEYDCDFTEDGKPETRAQKRDRLRCEKAEKEREKSEERIAKFEDKMEDIKDRCEVTRSETKLECLTREFNSATSRFTGRNAIPANVVQRYFKNVVGGELSKMLFNNEIDAQTAMSTLHDVFDGLPSEYGQIRQNILTAVQNETKNRSQAINEQYKLADTFAKQNKPQEYLQTMNEAQAAHAELNQMANVYSAAAKTSDAYSSDTSFAKYYQQTYLPAMNKIFSLMGPAAAATAVTPEEKVENSGTRQNTRGSVQSGSTTPVATGTRGQASSKVSNGSPSQWEFLNSSTGGVRVGTPSNSSRGNTRGARSMGN